MSGGSACALHRLAVDDKLAVDHPQRVAGKADHALDIIGAGAGRRDDDDVAALGHVAEQPALHRRKDVEARADPRPAVGIFADHQPVAGEQPRHHRFRRDVEGLGDQAVEGEHREQHPQQALDLAPQRGAFALPSRPAGGRLVVGGRLGDRYRSTLKAPACGRSGSRRPAPRDNRRSSSDECRWRGLPAQGRQVAPWRRRSALASAPPTAD